MDQNLATGQIISNESEDPVNLALGFSFWAGTKALTHNMCPPFTFKTINFAFVIHETIKNAVVCKFCLQPISLNAVDLSLLTYTSLKWEVHKYKFHSLCPRISQYFCKTSILSCLEQSLSTSVAHEIHGKINKAYWSLCVEDLLHVTK